MEVMALVRDVNETLATIKGNVKRTSEVLAAWVANPMFDRKEGKVCCHVCLFTSPSWCIDTLYIALLPFKPAIVPFAACLSPPMACYILQVHSFEELTNAFRDVSSKCHSLISDGGKEITKLLSSSNRTLKVSKGAPAWKAYVDYIGDIVIDGLVECIIASVHRLTSQASHCSILASTAFSSQFLLWQ